MTADAQPSDAEIRRKLRERCSETFELAREAGDSPAARARARERAADAADVTGDARWARRATKAGDR